MYPLKFILTTTFLLLTSMTASALTSDRHQPINIEANRAVRDDRQGTMVYQGNVVVRQGTILIRAAKVTVYSTDSKASRVVCVGTPAHYQQRQDGDKGLVLASANTIEYKLDSDQIHLIDNASLEQEGGKTMSGDKIDYDIAREVVKAKGDTDVRVIMVIPPHHQAGADKPEKTDNKGSN